MIAVVVVAVLLLAGVALRTTISPIARARIPASVVGGLLGCVVAQLLLAFTDRYDSTVQSILADYRNWGGILISIVFAGLLLAPEGDAATHSRDVWQQGVAAWIIILGQLAIGLIATALFIRPFYSVPAPFGQYIEVTMAGGFGSSRAMGTLLASDQYHFPQGTDLLIFGATLGLLWGVVSGLVFAKLGQARGWTQRHSGADAAGTHDPNASPVIVTPASSQEAIVEPILFQLCLLAVAFGIGLLMQSGVATFSAWLDKIIQSTDGRFQRHLGDLPLFFFALIGGWVVRLVLQWTGQARLLHREMIHRLCGIAMDVLIVSSLSAMVFSQLSTFLWPVLMLLALGSIWSALCLVWLSPRLLPRRYWFELGLINYGFSTAATAQGMMFLKIVDPELKSGAAETYALGAPLTAPFIGGGVITFLVLPPLIGTAGLIPVAMVSIAIVGALYGVGRRLQKRDV